ncbi:aldehyde dehydrogenase family protein [Streptomyces sp. MUSC 125]|uniref:aldehyde dehydrogenase family protein n=1 Tax=Streptomyces sp. MUSC 125 TaxID=1428624 RepID=UPI002D21AE3A|nr:aldehyde dehydrogenase family protein [Streptomyces sp. MUSC 125]
MIAALMAGATVFAQTVMPRIGPKPVVPLGRGLAAAGPADADAAVAAAWNAFHAWSRTTYDEKRRILLRAADLLGQRAAGSGQRAAGSGQRAAEHYDALALEIGAVRPWAEMNIKEAAANPREAASSTSTPRGSVLPSHDPGTTTLDLRQPAGVVLAMIPWNAPVVLAPRAVAIALAAGNTVILRPSEAAPHSAGPLLAEVLVKAGLPDGVVNVLTCAPADSPALVDALVERPEVRRVVFIGSPPVGRSIAQVAGSHLTPVVMELGGKNTTIVLHGTDPDRAADLIAVSAFANSGQVCMSTDQVLVAEPRYEDVVERLVARAEALKASDLRTPGTAIGSLINQRSADHFHELLSDARAHGARVLTGGSEPEGLLACPTVLGNVGRAARFHREEAFSPLVSVQPCATERELVELAHGTPYGLIASVLADDTSRALRVAQRLRVAAVHINEPSVGDEPRVPFGGGALSGFGHLGGSETWHFFTEQKTFYVMAGSEGLACSVVPSLTTSPTPSRRPAAVPCPRDGPRSRR